MEKYITDFKEINNDGDYAISVAVHQIESGKLKDIVELLRKEGFKLTSVDADSIDAEFVGGYDSAWQAIDRIKAKGFIWNQ